MIVSGKEDSARDALPLISIVVLCYNVENYLDQCIDSICSQTYTSLEIILVNDGSRDATPFCCETWNKQDDRITVVHQSNKGVAEARNAGLSRARGTYVAFVDGDDYISTCYIETLLKAAQKLNSDIVMCGYESVSDKGKPLEVKRLHGAQMIALSTFIEGVMEGRYFCSPWGKLFKRDLFDSMEYEAGRLYEDTLFWGSALKTWGEVSIGVVFQTMYKYRQSEGSIMHSFHGERERDLLYAWDSVCDAAEARIPCISAKIARRRTWSRFNLMDRMAFSGVYSGALLDEARDFLAKHRRELLYSPMFGKRGRVAYLLIPTFPKLYMVLTNRYLNRK